MMAAAETSPDRKRIRRMTIALILLACGFYAAFILLTYLFRA